MVAKDREGKNGRMKECCWMEVRWTNVFGVPGEMRRSAKRAKLTGVCFSFTSLIRRQLDGFRLPCMKIKEEGRSGGGIENVGKGNESSCSISNTPYSVLRTDMIGLSCFQYRRLSCLSAGNNVFQLASWCVRPYRYEEASNPGSC